MSSGQEGEASSHEDQMREIMRQQEEMMKQKMGGGPLKKKAPLIQKDHKYFDSLDHYKKLEEENPKGHHFVAEEETENLKDR